MYEGYKCISEDSQQKEGEGEREREGGRGGGGGEGGKEEKKKKNLKGLEIKKKVFCAELNIILFPLKGLRKQRQS